MIKVCLVWRCTSNRKDDQDICVSITHFFQVVIVGVVVVFFTVQKVVLKPSEMELTKEMIFVLDCVQLSM